MLELWRRLEEEGRERASRRDEVPRNDVSFLDRITQVVKTSKFTDFASAISASAVAISIPAEMCYKERIPRGECPIPDFVVETMKLMDESARKVIGNRCTWLLGRSDRYNLSTALNDLTACFHRLLELEERSSGKLKQISERVSLDI